MWIFVRHLYNTERRWWSSVTIFKIFPHLFRTLVLADKSFSVHCSCLRRRDYHVPISIVGVFTRATIIISVHKRTGQGSMSHNKRYTVHRNFRPYASSSFHRAAPDQQFTEINRRHTSHIVLSFRGTYWCPIKFWPPSVWSRVFY